MKPHFTQPAGNDRSDQRQYMQSSQYDDGRPLINWKGIFQRIWMFLKRSVSELWYMLLRRTGVKSQVKTTRSVQRNYFNSKWSIPVFKVAVAVVMFMYVMQRDIQFTIEMKAPLGNSGAIATSNYGGTTDQMGFASPVSLTSPSQGTKRNPALSEATVEGYIERFASLAQAEMSKNGIPASIKMAQAIIESRAGKSVAARVDNNHFGTPLAGQPFESAWRNWREHSLLIQHQYSRLLRHGQDYRAWARGLEEAKYSDRNNYANELLEVIERFDLQQLDDSTI